MSSDDNTSPFEEDLNNIFEFSQNDIFLRQPSSIGDFTQIPRATFDELHGEAAYNLFLFGLAPIVFIDVLDIFKFLKIRNKEGFEALDLKVIAQLVCDTLGDDDNFYDILMETFDEDITNDIVAKLGLDELNHHTAHIFNNATNVLAEIADVIKSYLINAQFPIVENESVYTVAGVQKGLIALRLRTFDELVNDYGG